MAAAVAGGAPLTIAVAGGTGHVGITLASKLVAKGHHIHIGSTHPDAPKAVAAVEAVKKHAAGGGTVTASTNAAAVAAASVVILTFPSATTAAAVADLVAQLGDTKGKVVLDATNPLGAGMELVLEGMTSAGEEFARCMPAAHVYKAFNTIGVAHMADPLFHGHPIDMLFAGDAAAAPCAVAERVIGDVGFHPRYVGPIRLARNLESLCEMWVTMSYKYGTGAGGAFGFTVVTK